MPGCDLSLGHLACGAGGFWLVRLRPLVSGGLFSSEEEWSDPRRARGTYTARSGRRGFDDADLEGEGGREMVARYVCKFLCLSPQHRPNRRVACTSSGRQVFRS